ncbi:MAG: DUF1934 domain-containing protein [Clostridiales Family XIII bacterium]|jgi:uncharacterized beta-barrel protein YwiB (DUF1934 family)|nr:DUF1934 domain-containing protein [Clostridiales Family XIII bacterium]
MKDILLKIIGNQIRTRSEDTDLDGQMEFITEGRFFKKGYSLYLVYEESEFSGMEGCTTSLKITGDKIKMKRFGEDVGIETAIEFEKGKRFNGYYDTPFGSVEMEVLTNKIDNHILDTGEGTLDIDYNISLKGLAEGRSKLSIEII